ncbi:MAG: hypothetical protein CSA75_00575, partial [Sorangium cellulosum]
PPDVLAALDNPLEVSNGLDVSSHAQLHTPVGRATTGAQGTSGGSAYRFRPGTDIGESIAAAEPTTAHGRDQSLPSTPESEPTANVQPELPNSSISVVYDPLPAPLPTAPWQPGNARSVDPNTLPTPIPNEGDCPARPISSPLLGVTEMQSNPAKQPGGSSQFIAAADVGMPASTVPRTVQGQSIIQGKTNPNGLPTPQADPLDQDTQAPQFTAPNFQAPNFQAPSITVSKEQTTDFRQSSPLDKSEQRIPEVLSPEHDGLRVLGTCIASRVTSTLCFEHNGALCRAVMREGDFVTCGSSADDESLLAFLMLRGDMPREVGMQMVGRIPPFGRHAAAALIANGYLGQDQLWPTLRAHAEWLLGRMVRSQYGTCSLEFEPPGRLKAEPAVFGGATGAEVLVEVTRRVLPFEDALARVGGVATRLGPGVNHPLLAECALPAPERDAVEQSAGSTIETLIKVVGQTEFAAIIVALHELGVLELMVSVGRPKPVAADWVDPLDGEAIRKRIAARLAIIQEGDYFEVIGVPRAATGYEIRRAYLESRRAFEPTKILTAETADLLDDARLIVEVLDEAFELLREEPRRERYRKALEAAPPQF